MPPQRGVGELSTAALEGLSQTAHFIYWNRCQQSGCGADKAEGLSIGPTTEGEVDGLSTAEVDELFKEADHDGDGRLAGNEAKAFFQRTSLPVQALSKVQPGPCRSHPI